MPLEEKGSLLELPDSFQNAALFALQKMPHQQSNSGLKA